MSTSLAQETGTVRKKWTGRLPVALMYPNIYPLAVSNLGFQLVYSLLNDHDEIVCERFVYPQENESLRSLESNRPLADFPVIMGSVSFEEDFSRLVAMLSSTGTDPFSSARSEPVKPGSPLVILGGVAVFMNPEPLASFADIMVIGEAEPVLDSIMDLVRKAYDAGTRRHDFLVQMAASLDGCYVPSMYSFQFFKSGAVRSITASADVPVRVRKVIATDMIDAAHSKLYSPDAELPMHMTELGRGCSRGCRFCAAGFIYRPPRLWDMEKVLGGVQERPAEINRVGLLGMEMADPKVLDHIAGYLEENSCSLSFSSLRADRISDRLLSLLSGSGLKSAAIAPDGCSERLRKIINKGLTEEDLLAAATKLVEAGIVHLKLYVMIGLPTETEEDLLEMVNFIGRLQRRIMPFGRKRGRVTKVTLSVNSFVPKPWTPFQYVSFGGLDPETAAEYMDESIAVMALKQKIKYLRKNLSGAANLRIKTDRPERILLQAVLSRGDRRLAPVLHDMAVLNLSFKKAIKKNGLTAWEYAVRPRDWNEIFCWDVIDHGIEKKYLWQEYLRGMNEKATKACDISICHRCGVCNHGKKA
ncbi:MAG: radical SAM protein [Desulfobulbaceae bacterium]|nr:radical SAM protein [Desulfobulbaceae bacterium]